MFRVYLNQQDNNMSYSTMKEWVAYKKLINKSKTMT